MFDFTSGGTKFLNCSLAISVDGILFAQEAPAPAPGPGPGTGPEGGGGQSMFGDSSFIWVMLAIGVLFYFMMILPERKQKAKLQSMLAALKKNDRVVTTGGIHGTVVNASKDSKDVTIRIDDSTNTKIRVERSSIRVVVGEEEKDKTTDSEQQESE